MTRIQIDFQIESQSAGDIGKSNNVNNYFNLPIVVFQLDSITYTKHILIY